MGAAAQHRGDRLISAQIDAGQKSADAILFDDLLTFARHYNGAVPFQGGVIRVVPGSRPFCLMNKEHTGLASSCFSYRTLWSLCRAWRIVVTGRGRDEHSEYFRFEPLREARG